MQYNVTDMMLAIQILFKGVCGIFAVMAIIAIIVYIFSKITK